MKITASINNAKTKISRPFSLLSIKADPIPKQLGSSNGINYTTILDKNYTSYPLGLYVIDYQLSLNTIGNTDKKTAAWSSNNPAVATVNSSGYVSYVSNGSCIITATVDNQSTNISLNMVSQNIVSDYFFSDYISNSLAKHIKTNIANKLNNQTNLSSDNKKNIFLIQDHSNSIYIRNIDCWAYGYDLTPISPWNFDTGSFTAGTLISPRHVLFCKHYSFYPQVPRADGQPTTIRFINQNNNTVTRTLTNILPINSTNFYPDFTIGLLDSDVTMDNGVSTGISFAKILPSNWYSYLPTLAANAGKPYNTTDTIPIMYTDQQEKCLLAHWLNVSGSNPTLQATKPGIPGQSDLFEDAVRFDSGNPIFTIINNELVILSVITGSLGGSYVSSYISTINQAMNQLGGGYQLTPVNLSTFSIF